MAHPCIVEIHGEGKAHPCTNPGRWQHKAHDGYYCERHKLMKEGYEPDGWTYKSEGGVVFDED